MYQRYGLFIDSDCCSSRLEGFVSRTKALMGLSAYAATHSATKVREAVSQLDSGY